MRAITAFSLATTLVTTAFLPVANAEIYKTVDKNGRVIYTDLPPSDTKSKVVELPTINTVPETKPTQNYETSRQQTEAVQYEVSITGPEEGTTLMPQERSVDISVGLNHSLEQGHSLSYYIDDALIITTTDTVITLDEPGRGEHKLTAEVVDGSGQVLGKSQPVTLIVVRPTVKQISPTVPGKK